LAAITRFKEPLNLTQPETRILLSGPGFETVTRPPRVKLPKKQIVEYNGNIKGRGRGVPAMLRADPGLILMLEFIPIVNEPPMYTRELFNDTEVLARLTLPVTE